MNYIIHAFMFLLFVSVAGLSVAASAQAMLIGDYTILWKLLLIIIMSIYCAMWSLWEMHQ